LRSFRWGELKAINGILDWTLLEAAPQDVRQNLKKLQQESEWETLAEAAEEAMALPCGRAWLDLQRYAICAAEQLARRAIATAVAKELKEALGEFPQLLESTLTDDTPAANAQTLAFLKERNLLPSQSGGPLSGFWGRKDAAAAEAEPEDEEQPVRRALRSGKTEEAIQLVSRRLAGETNGRGRFQRKAQLAEILVNAERAVVAFPILKELVQEVREKHLEQWEAPEVITPPLALYYKCLAKLGGAEEEKQEIFSLISRLDPVRAFELT
jgi:type VI secretion system protein ImpA